MTASTLTGNINTKQKHQQGKCTHLTEQGSFIYALIVQNVKPEKIYKKVLTNGGVGANICKSSAGDRERRRAVPCKLNNVKMTFITLDKYKVCLRFKKQPTKILE